MRQMRKKYLLPVSNGEVCKENDKTSEGTHLSDFTITPKHIELFFLYKLLLETEMLLGAHEKQGAQKEGYGDDKKEHVQKKYEGLLEFFSM